MKLNQYFNILQAVPHATQAPQDTFIDRGTKAPGITEAISVLRAQGYEEEQINGEPNRH